MENSRYKFRAWNKDKSIMVYSNEDNERTWWDGVRGSDVEIVNQRFKENSLYDWMQYTGLKDKNGKEIYEGDLLEDEEKQLWEVVYEKCQYILVNVYMPGARFIDNDLEVIGNIYEDKLEG